MKTPVAILTASRACFPGLPFSVGEQSEYKQDLGKKRNEEGKVRSRFLIAWKEDAMDGQKKGSVWKKTKGRAWAGCWPQQEYLEAYTYKPYWCWLGPRHLRAMLVNTHLTEILEVDQPRAHEPKRNISHRGPVLMQRPMRRLPWDFLGELSPRGCREIL